MNRLFTNFYYFFFSPVTSFELHPIIYPVMWLCLVMLAACLYVLYHQNNVPDTVIGRTAISIVTILVKTSLFLFDKQQLREFNATQQADRNLKESARVGEELRPLQARLQTRLDARPFKSLSFYKLFVDKLPGRFTLGYCVAAQTIYEDHFKLPAPHSADILAQFAQKLDATTPQMVDDIFLKSLTGFLSAIPLAKPSPFTTPFLNRVQSEDQITQLFLPFRGTIFSDVCEKYYSYLDLAHQAVDLKFFESDQIVAQVLNKTPFAPLLDSEIPLAIPETQRFYGTWIVAPHGRGKTTLLSVLLQQDLARVRDRKASIIIFDGKGDIIDHARKLKIFAPGQEMEGQLNLIELADNLSINFLDLGVSKRQTISLLENAFSVLDNKASSNMSTLLRMLLILCAEIPNANLTDFRRMLSENGVSGYEPAIGRLDEDERSFFTHEFNSQHYRETKQAILARLRRLSTESDVLKGMFRATETKIRMKDFMDTPSVTIIDTSWRKLSEEGSEFYSRFFLALILAQAHQRQDLSDSQKNPVYVYIDEAQYVIANESKVAAIIQTCRSQKIALILAHQELQQIKSEDVKGALGNCGIRFVSPDEEAEAFARKMDTSTAFLKSLSCGEFALYIRDSKLPTTKIKVPDRNIKYEHLWPKMTDAEFAEIQQKMRDKYCYTPELTVPGLTPDLPPDDETAPQKWKPS